MVTAHRSWALTVRSGAADGGPLVAIEIVARDAGLHPELVRRLVTLGAIEPSGGTALTPLFAPDAASRLARIVRLRYDLGLNYNGAVLATELLARIDELQDLLDRLQPRPRR